MQTITLPGPLVSPYWLRDNLGQVHLLDARWHLDDPKEGRRDWLRGHIPGAVHVDLDRDLADLSDPLQGRHPLPDPVAFAHCLADLGIDEEDPVVIYDDQGGAFAARVWWMLRWIGGPPAAVLDGGLSGWRALGCGVEVMESTLHPVPYWAPEVDPALIVGFDEVRDARARMTLLDARAPERFRGEVEPLDPVAGHILGAVNAPWKHNLDDNGYFRPPEGLRAYYEALGVDDPTRVVCMCGSGVTACHDLLALEVAGLGGGRLYAGSWSEWSRRGLPASL